MPVKKADRQQLHHVIDDQQQPRMWYTLSSCLVPQYMLCLLKASELKHLHGIERFPHYSPKPIWDYGQILEKGVVFEHKPDSPRPALCNDDGEVEAESVEGAAEQLLSLEDMYGAVAEEEETLEEMLIRELGLEDAQSEAEDLGSAVESEGDLDDVASTPAAQPEPPPSSGTAGPARKGLKKLKWGPCFDIAFRRRAGKINGLEARCPFHRKSSRTGCKKTFDFDVPADPDDSVIDVYLNALKWWCNCAKVWDRQKDHVAALEDVMAVPMFDEQALEAGKISGPKPKQGEVKTDDQLDRELAKASKLRVGAEPQGARGRGRGRARGRGRQAHQAGPQEHPPHPADERPLADKPDDAPLSPSSSSTSSSSD